MTLASNAPTPKLRACLVSRDLADFALLIEDMDALLSDDWGELNLAEAAVFLRQSDARDLEFLVVATDEDDRSQLPFIEGIMAQAALLKLPTLLVAEDLTTAELHGLMRSGAAGFVPYPLPQGALATAVDQLLNPVPAAPVEHEATTQPENPAAIFAMQGLSGGTGSTTMAVNLANELALQKTGSVCLIDLDLQFGNVAGQLDLTCREAVLDLLSDIEVADPEGFRHALQSVEENFQILAAPSEIVPFDLLDTNGLTKLLHLASAQFDYVVIDMPKTLQNWSEAVFSMADVVFCPLELDIRSAHAATRFRNTLLAEGLPYNKVRFALNRAPKFTDLTGRSRIKKLAEALGASIDILMPDGGKVIAQSADHGICLAEAQPKNPLRREVAKLAQSLGKVQQTEQQAA